MIVTAAIEKADIEQMILAEELLRSHAADTPGSAKFIIDRADALAIIRSRLTVSLTLAARNVRERTTSGKAAQEQP